MTVLRKGFTNVRWEHIRPFWRESHGAIYLYGSDREEGDWEVERQGWKALDLMIPDWCRGPYRCPRQWWCWLSQGVELSPECLKNWVLGWSINQNLPF